MRRRAEEAQRRFTILRLRFNTVLTQFDMFADVITQRSENETGVWLSGLDVAAADALALPGYYEPPPVICYLDRDIGAAIRRARTRMPGGGENPVAIIRVPRERMVGTGIASSLVHEVGHQAAALLDLVNSLRPMLRGLQRGADRRARLAALGTLDFRDRRRFLVGRPRRHRLDARPDGRGQPAARIRLPPQRGRSASDSVDSRQAQRGHGEALYPHPQWRQLSAMWESVLSPLACAADTQGCLPTLQASMPAFVALLVNHRPAALRGRSLAEVMDAGPRQPARLAALYQAWHAEPSDMYRASPSLVFAVMGQARADGKVSPEDESFLLGKLLTFGRCAPR